MDTEFSSVKTSDLNPKIIYDLNKSDKFKKELTVFYNTITYGMTQNGYVKNIISKLDGDLLLSRKNSALPVRPDFFIKRKTTSVNKKNCLIGVEHFHVDATSFKNSLGKIKSNSKKFDGKVKPIINKVMGDMSNSSKFSFFGHFHYYLQQADNANDVEQLLNRYVDTYKPDDDIIPFIDATQERVNTIRTSRVSDMIDSFVHGYDKHLKKVTDYMENMDNLNTGIQRHELVFLIDINIDGNQFWLINNENERPYDRSWFFKELVDHVKKYTNSKLTYIIFSVYKFGKVIDVFVINTKRIDQSIKKQNKKLYGYLGLNDSESEDIQAIRKFYNDGRNYIRNSQGFITDDISCSSIKKLL